MHVEGTLEIGFSGDNRVLATESEHDAASAPAGMPVVIQGWLGKCGVALGSGGKISEVSLWDVATRRQLGRVLRTPDSVRLLAISHDGTVLATQEKSNVVVRKLHREH